jgi:D-3-phosphoglycerate dehydrogenase / 2-oxoglutarate reductase
MHRSKVLITDLVDNLLVNGLVEAGMDVDYHKDITQLEVNNIIHEYSGIVITTKIGLTEDVIAKAENLKWIARAGSGMDHVDVKAATEKRIACIVSPEGNAGSVGEHCVALLLSMLRQIPEANSSTKAFTWQTDKYRVTELAGLTIGIIGYGHTGPAFAKRLQGFDVKVIAYDKYKMQFEDSFATKVEMEELFERSDALSIHLPLTVETRNMIDTAFINRFKNNIYFINTSRGHIAPNRTLIDALNSGKIKQAAIDVVDNEDFDLLTPKEQSVQRELLAHPSLIATPHVAGKSSITRKRHAEVLLAKILAHSGL